MSLLLFGFPQRSRMQRSRGGAGAIRDRRARHRPQLEAMEDRRLLSGFFQAPVSTTAGGTDPSSIRVADFNRDGLPDLAVMTGAQIDVLQNQGSGHFSTMATVTAAAGQTFLGIAVGDMNHDGQTDIVAVYTNPTLHLRTYLNNAGTFTPAAQAGPGGSVGPTISSAVADFNGDGNPDLKIAYTPNGAPNSTVRYYTGDGDGTFSLVSNTPISGPNPGGMVAGDFNRDGSPDVAAFTTAGLSIVPSGGAVTGPLAVGTNPNAIVEGDFNHDGRLDLAVASDSGVDVLMGNGLGQFPATQMVPVTSAAPAARSLAVVDFNRDGGADLATIGADGQVHILVLNPLTGYAVSPLTFAPGANPTALAAADVNNDARDDLLVANAGGANNVNALLGGLDTGNPRVISTQYDFQHGTLTIQFQDNASGLLQSALANAANYQVFFRKGKKTFVPINITAVTVSPPGAANEPQSVTLTLAQKPKRNMTLKVVVKSSGIKDVAGNPLDGLFNGAFPSGNGLLVLGTFADFTQTFPVKKK